VESHLRQHLDRRGPPVIKPSKGSFCWIVMTRLHEANSESFASKGATFSREHSE
jgi:hypothetical protein